MMSICICSVPTCIMLSRCAFSFSLKGQAHKLLSMDQLCLIRLLSVTLTKSPRLLPCFREGTKPMNRCRRHVLLRHAHFYAQYCPRRHDLCRGGSEHSPSLWPFLFAFWGIVGAYV